MTGNTDQRRDSRSAPRVSSHTVAKHGGTFVGHVLGGMLSKVIVALVLALVAAYLGATKIAHLNPFSSHTTISATAVLGKLTKIEQVHVATRSYPVDVKITQSVGIIPCFLVCNQMQLTGSGTDDAIVNLATLSSQDVNVDQGTSTVTIYMAPPAVGPAELNPAACSISSGHGVINTATQGFRSNPNGYRPLYAAAESQIHAAALGDHGLVVAGEQSTVQILNRLLGPVGVKKVIVNFS
jgi:Protein of unknown function (DUF4230)